MKIVYCTKHITNNGGVERILTLKANHLADKGYEVSIISVADTFDKPFYDIDPRVKLYSLGCDDFFAYHGLKKKLRFKRNVRTFVDKITPLLEEIRPDIAISTFDKYSRFIYMVRDGSKKILERHYAKHKRAQYMAKLEKCAFGRMLTRFYRRKEYRIIRKYDRFVVLTEEDKGMWGELPNIIAIPNCLTFRPAAPSPLDGKRIIALGRLSKSKRFDALARMWSEISGRYPDWKLVIYGNGDDPGLQKMIARPEVGRQTEVHPATSNVERELLDSSIYAMTSRYEGLPMVLLEAISCGLPAVSYACHCGPRDIIEDGVTGFLVDPGDEKTFVEKLALLIEDEERRREMGKAAYESADRFSRERVMRRWMDLFETLTDQSKPPRN